MNIEFNCPECGQLVAVDSKYTGTNVQCPECKAEITVPKPEFATIEQQRAKKKIDKEPKGAQGGTPKQGIWSKICERAERREGEEEIEDALVERYPALRIIAGVYRFSAWLFLILGIIGAIVALRIMEGGASKIGSVSGFALLAYSIIGGILGFLGFLSCSEIIGVFLDIEENTRETVELHEMDVS